MTPTCAANVTVMRQRTPDSDAPGQGSNICYPLSLALWGKGINRMTVETTAPAYVFYEDCLLEWGIASITLAEDEQGDVFYPVRTMCEAIGVARHRQASIIREDTRTTPGVRDIDAPTAGGKQKMLFLRRHETAIWLAIIDPARVGDTLKGNEDETPRERLLSFQASLWALADRIAFRRRQGVEASAGNPTSVARLVGGYARAETHCPDCGAPLIAEVENGELRLTHK